MTERSFPWDGLVTGDATLSPYDAATEFATWLRLVGGSAARTTNKGGVYFGENNGLAPASVGTSPVTIDTGAAIVYGTIYENTASVNVAIPTPAGSTRIDLIVLRKSWASQTVRITRIAGTEGNPAPPMIQTAALTWDVPLASVSITTGGVITITDQREYGVAVGSTTNPTGIGFDVAASPGARTTRFSSREDHTHSLTSPAAPVSQAFNDIASAGVSGTPPRSDHRHGMPKIHQKYKTAHGFAANAIDAVLQGAVLNGEIYIVEGVILYEFVATDIIIALSVPGGSTWEISVIGPDLTVPATLKQVIFGSGTQSFGTDAVVRSLHYRGSVLVGSDGNLGVYLGSSSGAASVQVRKFSTFTAAKVG